MAYMSVALDERVVEAIDERIRAIEDSGAERPSRSRYVESLLAEREVAEVRTYSDPIALTPIQQVECARFLIEAYLQNNDLLRKVAVDALHGDAASYRTICEMASEFFRPTLLEMEV